jgi:hypothetical protein
MQTPIKAAENKQPVALVQPIRLPNKAQLSNQVTKLIQYESITQLTTNSEGRHTNDGLCRISKGAGTSTKSFPKNFVTRRLLEYGDCQSGNYIGNQSLDQQ